MKQVHWVGSSLEDLRALPLYVQDDVGYALYIAQLGGKAIRAKPLAGFKGASVFEVVVHRAGEAYRAVYTVKLADAIYVLHVFHKKSKRGAETPQADVKLIEQRLNKTKVLG